MREISIALEWFLNPDHLAFIAGIQTKAFEKAALAVKVIEPKEHYDGFDALRKQKIDIHCNEPLHLFEHHFDGIKSLGCFFETRGGVMLRKESVHKLQEQKPLRITTPAANPVTNKIGFEILYRYAKARGIKLKKEHVSFVQKDFWHLKNLQEDESLDGAWLCFYNFEGVEAEYLGFENLFIDQEKSAYANFSALELMCTQEVLETKKEALCDFVRVCNEMITYVQENPNKAKEHFYSFTNTHKTALMDSIIEDTLQRFRKNFCTDGSKWQALRAFLQELDIVTLSDEAYSKIWEVKGH